MFDTAYNIALFTIGIISSLITIVGWFPQAIKTFKTHDTSGISLAFYSLIYISSIFWIIYAFLALFIPGGDKNVTIPSSLPPVLITNLVAIVLNTIILMIKIKNIVKAKNANMSEREYINSLNNKNKSTEN